MTKNELMISVEAAKKEINSILQLIYDELNNGQQKKLLKNSDIKNFFDLYNVKYQEEDS